MRNTILIALAGFLGYVIYNKMRKAAPVIKATTGALPEGYHQMPDGSIMANSAHMAMVKPRPTNGNGNNGSPGGGRPGIL
jgi:hypothetical protein